MTSRAQRLLLAVLAVVIGAAGIGHVVPAANGGFTALVTNDKNTATSAVLACRTAATALSPYLLYPFSETSGTTASDVSGNGRDGTYAGSGVTFGTAGPCGAAAVTLDGSTGSAVSPVFPLGLLASSEAIWFKTSVGGGLLVGLGSSATGASTTHDRSLYLSDNGTVSYAVSTLTGTTVLTSPSGYRDGAWHLAVATSSATTAVLYVDGVQVRSTAAVALNLAAGAYWRFGYDSLSGVGSTAPTNPRFTGSLAYASVYTTVLSAAQVATLWAARS